MLGGERRRTLARGTSGQLSDGITIANPRTLWHSSTVRLSSAKFVLALLAVAFVAPNCPAPDSVSLRILTDTGSRVALEDPLTFNAGTIYQGLSALGHTDKTPRAERTAIDNRAFPATLESMTVATWPLAPGLTTKGPVAKPDRDFMFIRLRASLEAQGQLELLRQRKFFPMIQDPDIVKPEFQRTERQRPQNVPPDVILPSTRPPSLLLDGYAWLRPEKQRIEIPQVLNPSYDYSGPPFLFNLPPELLKNPLFANDPASMKLFVKTNEAGQRDTSAASVATGKPVRRLRPASYWDAVEASNNPRADYDGATDYETKARNTTKGTYDLSDPNAATPPNDPKPSYDTRPYFNPQGRRLLRDPNAR